MPDLDRLYTVESVRPVGDGFSVRLKELDPSCYQGGACVCGACGWDAGRFRKIYRPTTEKLSVFTSQLTKNDELQPVG